MLSSPSALTLSQDQGLFQLAVYIRWPKYWSFSFSIGPSNEYAELSSLKIDCFDLLAVQETLRSLLQHHSSKASILWHFDFFIVQLLNCTWSTGKQRKTFVRNFQTQLKSSESESLGMGPGNLCTNKFSRWFWGTLKSETPLHCIFTLSHYISIWNFEKEIGVNDMQSQLRTYCSDETSLKAF